MKFFYTNRKMKSADITSVLLTPIALLTGENYPEWYMAQAKRSHKRSVRSFGGNTVLLTWCVLGSVLAYAYIGNLRSMYIRQDPSKQLDTSEDVYRSDKTVYLYEPYYYGKYLKTSKNPYKRILGYSATYFVEESFYEAMMEKMLQKGEGVSLGSIRDISYYLYVTGVKGKPLYFSKPMLPSHIAWIIVKRSPWRKFLDRYILNLSQVTDVQIFCRIALFSLVHKLIY